MTLDDWYRRQDAVVAANRAEFEHEYRWLDSALTLLTEIQLFVNGDPAVSAIRRKMQDEGPLLHLATALTVNLLNDAMGSLVSGIRLLLFGDHPDAYALARSAFEACCYAEHFVYHPDKAQSYMELEALLSTSDLSTALEVNLMPELRRRKLEFWRVSKELATRSGNPVGGFYARLCNLGSHSSPKRVGLRLSPPGGAVLAPVSKSTAEWPRQKWTLVCAYDMMAVAKYAVEMLFEHYPDWFVGNPGLVDRCKSLAQEFESLAKP
ncbi:MAG: hypothetical protein IH963_11615 [Chloroflexi bacterium]|nr:hypothetical protein [Chloroflexota bacterium]